MITLDSRFSLRGWFVWKVTSLRSSNFTAVRFTLLVLSTSQVMGSTCPETNPVCGMFVMTASGPERQQKQQNDFSSSSLNGSLTRGLRFRSTGAITVNAIFMS